MMNRPTEQQTRGRRVAWPELAAEPFRVLFPSALLAGVLGVLAWPLHFAGVLPFYPGPIHARLMAHGFFAGFMLGFLGTALPRMLSAPCLRFGEVGLLVLLHLAMTVTLFSGGERLGDLLLLGLIVAFLAMLFPRFLHRKDLPPPGFVLVLLAFGCLAGGTLLSLFLLGDESALYWARVQHLLSYQGFVLLPVLGVGAFLFPRFFRLPNQHDFPESLAPAPGWAAKVLVALATGGLIVGSFFLEAGGWHRWGILLRVGVAGIYLFREVPLYRARAATGTMSNSLRLGLGLVGAGYVGGWVVPGQRVALLHLTLVGGLALITLVVATRVVFGHSGRLTLLEGRRRWLTFTVWLVLAAIVTRISGDFWPKIRVSHYNYGALLWVLGTLIWAWHVMPCLLVTEAESPT